MKNTVTTMTTNKAIITTQSNPAMKAKIKIIALVGISRTQTGKLNHHAILTTRR